MLTESDTTVDLQSCIASLRRLEVLGRDLRHPSSASLEAAARDTLESEFTLIQEQLPAPVLLHLRGRIRGGQKLVAPLRDRACSSCYTTVPRGDQGAVRAARAPVFCPHCGILLVAERAEFPGATSPQ